MRIHIGPPPPSSDFDPAHEGWTALREPTPFLLQVIAAPIAIGLVIALYLAWSRMTPLTDRALTFTVETSSLDSSEAARSLLMTLARLVGGFLTLIVVHELLHAVTTPRWGMTPQTLIGVWPSRMLFYAAFLGPLSKARFIVVFLMPALVLTIIPLLLCSAIRLDNSALATISIVNGACACGDLVGTVMIGWQVPRGAVVRNQGWQTWWKMEREDRLDDV